MRKKIFAILMMLISFVLANNTFAQSYDQDYSTSGNLYERTTISVPAGTLDYSLSVTCSSTNPNSSSEVYFGTSEDGTLAYTYCYYGYYSSGRSTSGSVVLPSDRDVNIVAIILDGGTISISLDW